MILLIYIVLALAVYKIFKNRDNLQITTYYDDNFVGKIQAIRIIHKDMYDLLHKVKNHLKNKISKDVVDQYIEQRLDYAIYKWSDIKILENKH